MGFITGKGIYHKGGDLSQGRGFITRVGIYHKGDKSPPVHGICRGFIKCPIKPGSFAGI